VHAGVVLEVLRVEAPRSAAATNAAAHWHRSHADVRRLPGVTGTWTFASRDVTLGQEQVDRPGELLVAVHFCHTDPVGVAGALPAATIPPGSELLFRAPLESLPALR
jgi:hypothetical protein